MKYQELEQKCVRYVLFCSSVPLITVHILEYFSILLEDYAINEPPSIGLVMKKFGTLAVSITKS